VGIKIGIKIKRAPKVAPEDATWPTTGPICFPFCLCLSLCLSLSFSLSLCLCLASFVCGDISHYFSPANSKPKRLDKVPLWPRLEIDAPPMRHEEAPRSSVACLWPQNKLGAFCFELLQCTALVCCLRLLLETTTLSYFHRPLGKAPLEGSQREREKHKEKQKESCSRNLTLEPAN